MHRATLCTSLALASLALPASALADVPPVPEPGGGPPAISLPPGPEPTPTPTSVAPQDPQVPVSPVIQDPPPARDAPAPDQLLSVRLKGRRITLTLTCTSPGKVTLRAAAGTLGHGRFSCAGGRATATVPVSKRTAVKLRARKLRASVVLRTGGRTVTLPLSPTAPRRLKDAPLVTLRATCVGSGTGHGGQETIAVDSNTLFGAALGANVYWRSYVYAHDTSNPGGAHWIAANGWEHYVASDFSSSGYFTDEDTFVISGGFVSTSRQLWNVAPHTWTFVYLHVYTKATGYQWVKVQPNQAFSPAVARGDWCWFA